jgi:hypothetical protein
LFNYENIFKSNSEDEISEPATIQKEKKKKNKIKTTVKSAVWQHFVKKKIDNIEYDVCNVYNDDESELCGMRFKHSQSTSTLRRHLLNKHSSLGKIYLIFFDEINLKIY